MDTKELELATVKKKSNMKHSHSAQLIDEHTPVRFCHTL